MMLSRALLCVSLALILMCGGGTGVEAQDRHAWQSLAQLQPGDRIRLLLKTSLVEGVFQSWSPEQIVVGTVSARKDDVVKIEKYRPGAWGRRKKAAAGAAIGFGGGFALGAAGGDCPRNAICGSRAATGVFVGFTFAIIGAGIGALLPTHTTELIYSVK